MPATSTTTMTMTEIGTARKRSKLIDPIAALPAPVGAEIDVVPLVSNGADGVESADDDFEVIVRQRLYAWFKHSPFTQATFGKAIGRSGSWVSRFFAGEYPADLGLLKLMAAVLNHTVRDAFNLHPETPGEARVVEIYRALPKRERELWVRLGAVVAFPHEKRKPARRRRSSRR